MAETKSNAANPGKGKSNLNPRAEKRQKSRKGSNLLAYLAVPLCLIFSFLLFYVIFGDASNFSDAGKTQPLNFQGIIFTGGIVIPFLITLLLIVIVFVIERYFAINKAKGKIKPTEFLRRVQYNLANKNIDAAIKECDKQRGSVGNVMHAGLNKYKEMTTNTELTTEQKVMNIQGEIEEATTLELPMLEKNLVFLSTIASAATLLGLFGTVVGMIKAFQALGETGGGDSTQLAMGISEALVNTATGILASFIATIAYNFFTTNIDGITYGIDETGYTLTQSFAAQYE